MTDQEERTPRQLMVSQDYIDGIHSVHNAAAVQLRSRIVKLKAEQKGLEQLAADRADSLADATARIEELEAALRAHHDKLPDPHGIHAGTPCVVCGRALDPTEAPHG